MKRTPRRQRIRLKTWAYLALFGHDEDTETASAESSTARQQADDQNTKSGSED